MGRNKKSLTDKEIAYMRIYDSLKENREDFNQYVKDNIDNLTSESVTEMIKKLFTLIDFYVENKDNFRDDYVKVLSAEYHDDIEGAAKAVIVNMIQVANPIHYNNKDKKSVTASEMMKNGLRDKVGKFKSYYMDVEFDTGTDNFRFKYQVNELSVDGHIILDSLSAKVNSKGLKEFIKDEFNTIKSISHLYS